MLKGLCWGLMSQSTIFQSCLDGATASWVINQYFRGVKCLAQGHNTAAVGIEPPTSRSGVRHSTTEPPRSPMLMLKGNLSLKAKAQATVLSTVFSTRFFALFITQYEEPWVNYIWSIYFPFFLFMETSPCLLGNLRKDLLYYCFRASFFWKHKLKMSLTKCYMRQFPDRT